MCVAGSYLETNGVAAGSCKVCPSGQWSNVGSDHCNSCESGKFLAADASAAADHDAESKCVVCPSGTWSDAAASACEVCEAGRFIADNGVLSDLRRRRMVRARNNDMHCVWSRKVFE
jgi:hypothetical protein